MAVLPALELRNVTKVYPGVKALDAVEIELGYGEIHALLGENGAGKSTLIKILTGAEQCDEGAIYIEGVPRSFPNPKEAHRAGVSLVPQEVLSVPELNVGRNVLLGMEAHVVGRNRLSRAEKALVSEALDKAGLNVDPETLVQELSIPELRLVQIAKALVSPGEILILDEPTAVLSESDADRLMDRLEALREEGKAIGYVTHRLSEVMRLADQITILRDGRRVGRFKRGEIDREGIISLMSKDDKVAGIPATRQTKRKFGAPLLKVADAHSKKGFSGISLEARAGEIVGIAGVPGSGHGTLLQALAGLDSTMRGEVTFNAETRSHWTVMTAMKQGVIFVPADRRNRAIVPRQSVSVNIAIPKRVRLACRRLGLRWPVEEKNLASEYIRKMDIRPPLVNAVVGQLSGGNQQKVVLARAIECSPRILLIEEPTQGIDVHAKAEIHGLIRHAALESGCAVIIASSEFEELISLADTIYVMHSGQIVSIGDGKKMSYRDILSHAL